MEVMHIRVAEWTKDSRDVGWKQLVRGLIVPSDSKEAELLEGVAPIDDEIIVSKSSSGVFPVTNFDRLLRNLGITTLIFTGTSTGGCVESAVRDAVDLGYDVVVVSDGCADSTVPGHELALSRMHTGLCRIMSTEEIAARIRAQPDGSRALRSGVERVQEYLPKPPDGEIDPDISPYSLIFPPAIELPLRLDNVGLLLIDAQRFTCDPSAGLAKLAEQRSARAGLDEYFGRAEAALDNMAALLAACRKLGMPVIHARTAGKLPGGRDLSRHLREQGITLSVYDADAAIMPQAAPIEGEIVLDKPAAGCFTGTGLDELLRNLQIEHLVIAGISVGSGLESSIRSATDRGYGALVVPDASAAATALLQGKLYDLQSGIIQVRDTKDAIPMLEGLQTREYA
jgi:nicotinamidase-related amidase